MIFCGHPTLGASPQPGVGRTQEPAPGGGGLCYRVVKCDRPAPPYTPPTSHPLQSPPLYLNSGVRPPASAQPTVGSNYILICHLVAGVVFKGVLHDHGHQRRTTCVSYLHRLAAVYSDECWSLSKGWGWRWGGGGGAGVISTVTF